MLDSTSLATGGHENRRLPKGLRHWRNLSALWAFPYDAVQHLRDESHQSSPASHVFLRTLYRVSRGRSRQVIGAAMQRLRPIEADADPELIEMLRRTGLAQIEGFVSEASVLALHDELSVLSGSIVGGPHHGERASYGDRPAATKLHFNPDDLMRIPEVAELVASAELRSIAASYFRAVPIFTGLAAWWSFPDEDASDQQLDQAAQKFHFDYDWPLFLKFFVYLTPVDETNGPFTFVRGTHDQKARYTDGRRSDAEIEDTYGSSIRPCHGSAGDLIIADTSGFHKGARPESSPRLVLQLEYAISRLGASHQYPPLPRELRPANELGQTYAIFTK